MTPRHLSQLTALAALLAAFAPRVALAAERDCPAIAIEPDAQFRAHFPELLAHIQSELAARVDIDACAHVALRLEDDAALGVAVTLPDGRSASRSVARHEDVMATLEALLLVPEPAPQVSEPKPSPPPPAKVERPLRHHPRVAAPEASDRDVPMQTAPGARQLGFELSAVSGMRIGDGQFGYGAGVLSFLQIHSWLLGFQGRADGYRSISGSDPETALELAILAGYRCDFGSVALDFTAGPGVAMKGVTLSARESVPVPNVPPAAPPPRSEPSSGPVPRLLLGARLGFSPRSLFRTFVGIDGELGPSRTSVDPEENIESPRMPTFTVGLALGATVGTP
jgi:hypothetical protein